MPRRILVGSFVVDTPFFDDIVNSLQYSHFQHTYVHRYEPNSYPTDMIPATTRKEGFHYAGQSWYYSKVSAMGDPSKLVHDNFTILNEKEEEEFEMNCDVGDIRVGFETERMPNEVTVVGIQVSFEIACMISRMIIASCLFVRMEKLRTLCLIRICNLKRSFPILKRSMI